MDLEFLKKEVESAARNLGGGTLAVGYKNLATGETFFYNENHIFPAASIVKIPILLEYLRQKENGTLNSGDEVVLEEKDVVGGAGILIELHRGLVLTLEDVAHLMIVISDNTASNIMLDRVGMDEVNAFMKSLGLMDTVIGRKFMIDPAAKFSKNFTSVLDMVKLFEMVYRGGILSKESCGEAVEILSRQQYREKIPLLLPKDLKISHKTGEITGVRHDCALVLYESSPYVICFLTEELPDVILGDRILSELSRKFYDKTAGI